MITMNRRWRILVAAVSAVCVPALATPAQAAPDDTPSLAEARRVQAELVRQTGVTGVDDGYPGGLAVAAGATTTCAAPGFVMFCWGAGDPEPVEPPSSLESPYSVAAGRAHTCVLETFDESDEGGDLYCWGENAEGQVGDGSTTTRPAPVRVAQNVRQVAAGADHTCAILADFTVSCWGRNDVGQLGQGSAGASADTPQPVPGLADIADVAAGGNTTCTVDEDGTARCWGANDDGQVGDGNASATPVATPAAVVVTGVGADFTQIDLGRAHTCAVTDEHEAWCWGADTKGQLGDGAPLTAQDEPVAVPLEDVWGVNAGGDSSCSVDQEGTAHCWGDNAEGQLGVGDRTDRSEPMAVDVSAVPVSTILRALLGIDGGMLGSISIGDGHACGLDVQGNAFCWGDNADGQLGDGTTTDRLVPTATRLVPGVATDVAAQAGDAELRVTWKAPADLGVGSLSGYGAIAISDDGAAGRCFSPTPGCTVPELTNGAEYEVFVFTSTSAGFSTTEPVPAIPLGVSTPAPSNGGGGGGGGQLPITGAAVSLLILLGGGLVAGGMLLRRAGNRRAR